MAQDTLLGFPAHTLPYRRGEFTTLSTASVPAYYVRRDFPIWRDFSLRQFSLTGVELVVAAVLGQQILVVTPLDDAALLQNHNGLGVADGGEPVGDDEYSAPRHQPVHTFFDELFRPGVDGAGGLVQNQHRRVGAGGTGDVQKLPLALAEAAALAGEDRLITVRQVADEAVRSRQPGRGLHLLVGGVQTAIADVVCHRAGQEVGILQDHAQ